MGAPSGVTGERNHQKQTLDCEVGRALQTERKNASLVKAEGGWAAWKGGTNHRRASFRRFRERSLPKRNGSYGSGVWDVPRAARAATWIDKPLLGEERKTTGRSVRNNIFSRLRDGGGEPTSSKNNLDWKKNIRGKGHKRSGRIRGIRTKNKRERNAPNEPKKQPPTKNESPSWKGRIIGNVLDHRKVQSKRDSRGEDRSRGTR